MNYHYFVIFLIKLYHCCTIIKIRETLSLISLKLQEINLKEVIFFLFFCLFILSNVHKCYYILQIMFQSSTRVYRTCARYEKTYKELVRQLLRQLNTQQFAESSQPPPKPFESIPGPRVLPFIGSIYNYLPGGKYGTSLLIVEINHSVLKTKFRSYHSGWKFEYS